MRISRSLAMAAALALVVSAAATAQDEAPPAGSAETVVPAGEEPLGVPYGEWGARWWQWLLGIPVAEDPGVVDNCQANQSGEVFFIPHTNAGSTMVTSCEIGADQWVFAAPGGTIWTADAGETDEELQQLVLDQRSIFSNLVLTIDGVEVPDIDSFWATSDVFDITWIEDNFFEAEPGTTTRAASGVWAVMIPPLAPGEHVIVVRDDLDFGEGPMTAELTANITVAAPE